MAKPNILFIFGDQHRYGALGCNGNEVVRTPNFDRLAREGMACDQVFSCHPLCSPYRANVLTGTYAWKNLVLDNEYKMRDDLATLPRALAADGYKTGFIGKWHLGYGPYPEKKRHGFDYLAAYDCGHGFYKTSYHENEQEATPLGCWAPEGETNLAIEFMRRHRDGKPDSPFLLMVGWAPPHWPYDQYPQGVQDLRSCSGRSTGQRARADGGVRPQGDRGLLRLHRRLWQIRPRRSRQCLQLRVLPLREQRHVEDDKAFQIV